MRYLLLCLLLVGCATTQEQAKRMTQEQLCYTAGDARNLHTYETAINELKARGQECDTWIKHITSRQQHYDLYESYDYLRCDLGNGTYAYCAAASDMVLVTPIGPYPYQSYFITQ
jgi:hypothetical protein